MPVRVRDAGAALRTVKGIALRDAAGALRTIKGGTIRDATGVQRAFFETSALAVAQPDDLYGTGFNHTGASKVVYAGPVPLTVTGGIGTISYAWSRITGDAGIVPDSATVNAPVWNKSIPAETTTSARWQCVVTDAGGGSVTVELTITLQLVFNDPFIPI